MLQDRNTVGARNIILTAAAFWVAGAMSGGAFEAPNAIAQVASGQAMTPEEQGTVKQRIQGNLHSLLGLKFEEYILEKLKAQILLTLGTYDKLSVEAKQKTKDDAVNRLNMFLTQWRFDQYPVRTWTNNTNAAESVTWDLNNTNVDDIVKPDVIAQVKTRLREALDEAYAGYSVDTPLSSIVKANIARIATTGTSAGFGEWVCIFNPATGQTQWYNETTNTWGGQS